MVKCCMVPGRSQKRTSTYSMSSSLTSLKISSVVFSDTECSLADKPRADGEPSPPSSCSRPDAMTRGCHTPPLFRLRDNLGSNRLPDIGVDSLYPGPSCASGGAIRDG